MKDKKWAGREEKKNRIGTVGLGVEKSRHKRYSLLQKKGFLQGKSMVKKDFAKSEKKYYKETSHIDPRGVRTSRGEPGGRGR